MKKKKPKEKSAREVYEELSAKGEYKVIHTDYNVIKTIRDLALNDKKAMDFFLKQKEKSFRIIYRDYYTILRELCDALMRFDGFKISNHQGCFAYICIKFPELKPDWNLLEEIRKTRNLNMYEGKDILEKDWNSIEEGIKSHISLIKAEIDKKLKAKIEK